MSLLTSLFLLLIPAIGGWFLATIFINILFKPNKAKTIAGFSIRGVIPTLKPALGGWVAAAIQKEFLSVESVEKMIDDPALMSQLRPEIENHIDVFLKEKLKSTFPLLAGLMGEKTLATLKVAFLAEVELIFPSVLKNLSADLFQKWKPAEMIENKISGINLVEVERFVRSEASRQLFYFKLMGALAGLLIGIIQLLVLNYFA